MSTVVIDKRRSYADNANEYSPSIIAGSANLTPRIISTLFILALRSYFISNPEYKWDPDGNKTEIDIHAEWEEDDNLEKSSPVITVQNGPVSISPAGLGTGLAALDHRIIKRGKKTMEQPAILNSSLQATIDSSINISITGLSADDVNELAFTVGMFLLTLKYDVASVLQIQQLGNVQISPAQAMSKVGWANRYLAQISIPYNFTLTKRWEPVDVGKLIKSIPVSIDTKTKLDTDGRNYTHNTVKQVGD